MLVTQILNHIQAAQQRFMTQYANQNRVTSTMKGIVAEVQNIENALFSMDAARQLAYAIGAQLDALGTIIGQARNSLNDSNYRLLLQAIIAKNNSNTLSETLIGIIKNLYQASAVFVKTPNSAGVYGGSPPAFISFGVGSSQNTAVSFTQLAQIIQGAIAAGVALSYISSFNASAGKAFSMAGPQAWVGGFGDLNNPSIGGGFASLVYSNPDT